MIERDAKVDKLLAIARSAPDTAEGKNAAMRAGLILAKSERPARYRLNTGIVGEATTRGLMIIATDEGLRNVHWAKAIIRFRRTYRDLESGVILSTSAVGACLAFSQLPGYAGVGFRLAAAVVLVALAVYVAYLRFGGHVDALERAEERGASNESMVKHILAAGFPGREK